MRRFLKWLASLFECQHAYVVPARDEAGEAVLACFQCGVVVVPKKRGGSR